MDKSMELGLVPHRECVTEKYKIHGYRPNPDLTNHLYVYGSDRESIEDLMKENPEMAHKLSPKYDYTVAEVVWAVRQEMARTVEDVLARRVRLLFLDARVAIEVAPQVAAVMATELGKDQKWIDRQVKEFTGIAENFVLK